jgi:hypothetical protein
VQKRFEQAWQYADSDQLSVTSYQWPVISDQLSVDGVSGVGKEFGINFEFWILNFDFPQPLVPSKSAPSLTPSHNSCNSEYDTS